MIMILCAQADTPLRIFRVTERIVTNSSAAEGCIPTVLSIWAFVTPALTHTANPCMKSCIVIRSGLVCYQIPELFTVSESGVSYKFISDEGLRC
jgi:hypothetical protein